MKRQWVGLPLFLYALHAEAALVAPASTDGTTSQLLQVLLGLSLVIGLIVLLAWLLRRLQLRTGLQGGSLIRPLAGLSVGPRERLLLVQVGDEQVLLGLTPGAIRTLHVLREPLQLPASGAPVPEFAQRLMEMLGREQKG